MTSSSSERLERVLGVVLRSGAWSSAVLLAAGLVLELVGRDGQVAARLTQLGLIVLMATPVARVVVSVVDYAMERDWLFLGLTAAVLVILLGSLLVALA